ncbi:hypothetical protein MMC28_010854 [Mycoblastus sanguinarius]|nr:hypothetical protein [Mycoblastus sanguinarius]
MSTQVLDGIGLDDIVKAQESESGMYNGDMATSYNARAGGCNILLADKLISLVQPFLPPSSRPLRILDNACGPAIATTQCLANATICSHAALHISAVDISTDFIANNCSLIAQTPGWTSNSTLVDTAVMDCADLKFADDTFDASFTSLAIFTFPDPVQAARELKRTLKPGGVAALTTFKSGGWRPLFHEAERIVRHGAKATTFPFLDVWLPSGKLEQTMKDGGFVDVVEGEAAVMMWWGNRGEAAKNLADTLKVIVGSAWSESEKERMEETVKTIIDDDGAGIVKGKDGKIGVEMYFWTVIAKK